MVPTHFPWQHREGNAFLSSPPKWWERSLKGLESNDFYFSAQCFCWLQIHFTSTKNVPEKHWLETISGWEVKAASILIKLFHSISALTAKAEKGILFQYQEAQAHWALCLTDSLPHTHTPPTQNSLWIWSICKTQGVSKVGDNPEQVPRSSTEAVSHGGIVLWHPYW